MHLESGLQELTAFSGLSACESSETTNLGQVWRSNGAVAQTDATMICYRLPPALMTSFSKSNKRKILAFYNSVYSQTLWSDGGFEAFTGKSFCIIFPSLHPICNLCCRLLCACSAHRCCTVAPGERLERDVMEGSHYKKKLAKGIEFRIYAMSVFKRFRWHSAAERHVRGGRKTHSERKANFGIAH